MEIGSLIEIIINYINDNFLLFKGRGAEKAIGSCSEPHEVSCGSIGVPLVQND